MSRDDLQRVSDPKVQQYLQKRFDEIAYILIPHIEGYFLVVNNFSQLYQSHTLQYVTLLSIAEGLFDHVEAVSVESDIVEVSLLFNNEFLLSIVFPQLSADHLAVIRKEVKYEAI